MKPLSTFIIGLFLLVGLGAFGPPADVDVGNDIKIEFMQSDIDLEFTPDAMEQIESQEAAMLQPDAPPGELLKEEDDYSIARSHIIQMSQSDSNYIKAQKYRQIMQKDMIKMFNHRLE